MTPLPFSSVEKFEDADRLTLANLLKDETLRRAFSAVIWEAQPRTYELQKASPTEQASAANQVAGMGEFVRQLHLLATPSKELQPKEDVSAWGEWTHIEQLTE